ncbi:MAG TPA: carboxymuconolactone decarboxylase family protein [Jatrophihabitans sp.]|jgi:4-carboxymuconolactone decarboxylase
MAVESDGATRRALAQGVKAGKLQAALEAIDPDLGRWANEYVFGEVWAAEALPFDERMLVAITALSALNRRAQLRNYLHGALQAGIPEAKLREVMKMMTVYAGFPVAIESMSELDSVLAARRARS